MPRHVLIFFPALLLLAAGYGVASDAAGDLLAAATDGGRITASAPAMGRLVLRDTLGREGDSLEIRELRIHMRTSGPVALTEIEQTFHNPGDRQAEGTFYFAVPPGASLCRLAMYVDGVLVEGELVERAQARAIYESIVRRMRDPALMEWQDGSIFKTRIFPIPAHGPKRILISYTQLLPTRYGQRQYIYPLVGKTTQAVPIGRFELTAEIEGVADKLPVRVPAWQDVSVRAAEGRAVVRIECEKLQAQSDVAISWSPVRAHPIEAYPYRRAGEDGFLLLSYMPGFGRMGAPRRPARDVVLLFDTSLSRRPDEYRVQLMLAREILRGIGPDDRFALITFDVASRMHTNGFVASAEAQRAIGELEALAPLGGTDLSKAFDALGRLLDDSTPRGLPDVVLLSDGLGSMGERDTTRLLEQAEGILKKHPARIHGVAVGMEFERLLLLGLSRRSGGLFRVLSPGEDYQTAIGDLLFDLQGVILPPPKLECSGVAVLDVLPRVVEAVVEGEECFRLGRYAETGTLHATFRQPDGLAVERDVELKERDERFAYIPRLWAREQLDVLLDQPETNETRLQIIELSQEFTLITPYTSFLVLENEQAYAERGLMRHPRRAIWGPGGLASKPPPEEPGRPPVGRQVRPARQPVQPAVTKPTEPAETSFLARINPNWLRPRSADWRVRSTALNVLSLETYYRYLPMYKGDLGGQMIPLDNVTPQPRTNPAASNTVASPPATPADRSDASLKDVVDARTGGPITTGVAPGTGGGWGGDDGRGRGSSGARDGGGRQQEVMRHEGSVVVEGGNSSLEDVIGTFPENGGGWGAGMGVGTGRGSFGARNGGGRRLMVVRHGGSKATEGSVERGLRWLATHQQAEGGWGEGIEECSLGLLAFLGAGHTEKVGQFKSNVRSAVAWLTAKMDRDGRIGGDAYEQALAVAALSEACGLANVAATKESAQKAVDALCFMGEWGVSAMPNAMSNAWVVVALKSAKIAGLRVRSTAFERAIRYLDGVQDKQGLVRSADGKPDLLGSSCAALSRQFLGWRKEDLQTAAPAQALDEAVTSADWEREDALYLRYVGTLVMFHQGEDLWNRWNAWNKKALTETQASTDDDAGSWEAKGLWARGRMMRQEFSRAHREQVARAMATAVGAPEDGTALKALLDALAYANDTELLERMLKSADLHTNIRGLLLLRLGRARDEQGLHTAAAEALMDAYRLAGEPRNLLQICVRSLRLATQPERALDVLIKDLRRPGDIPRWEVRAAAELIQMLKQDVSAAIVEQFPTVCPVRTSLLAAGGALMAKRGDWMKAAELHGRAYAEAERPMELLSAYADALAHAGCWDTLADVYRQAFRDSGRDVALFEPYLDSLLRADRWEEAGGLLEGALRVGYRTTGAFEGLVNVYRRLGRKGPELLRAASCGVESFPDEEVRRAEFQRFVEERR